MVESRELRVGEYLNIRKVRGILRLFQLSQGRLGHSGFVDRAVNCGALLECVP